MLAEEAQMIPATEAAAQRAMFFRQSGWLMFANIAGGVLMWAVHFLNKFIPGGEYGSFGTFLAVVMVLPTIPLQMVLAQQTAKAIANHKEGELSGVFRLLWWGTTLCWLVGAVVVLLLQRSILQRWHMASPVGLWITLPIVLFSLWLPIFWGLLQGQQNFLWLGWTMILNGVGRLGVAAIAVLVLASGAAGMMTGVLLGTAISVAIGAWQTRSVWLTRPLPFDRRGLLAQIIPLALGFLGFQILFTADTMFVKGYFPERIVDFYVSAGTMSRALMWLVLPLASVMFPRIVHSAAKAQKTDLVGMVLLVTAVLAILGAVGLSLLGPWVVRLVYDKAYVQVTSSILPWYVSAMIPLGLANVLLNDLLARPASKWLPALSVLVLALGYILALTQFHDSLITVLKTLGIFNVLLLGICAWFTWGLREGTTLGAKG